MPQILMGRLRRQAERSTPLPAGVTTAATASARQIPDSRAFLLLVPGLALLLSQAWAPFPEFVLRGDDAYYYFKVAANYPQLGFWSFDGAESTNGVQPLWAWILTALAQVAAWLGISEAHELDRMFVGATALFQFGASATLFHLLARQVSVGTGVAAAGASLFAIGLVWGRVWGVESALLALMLTATATYYHLVARLRASWRTAGVLGVLLGLTALSRLNAGLLIPCLLGFHVLSRQRGSLRVRLRCVLIAGAAASAVVLTYLIATYASTGHVLPISGVVKSTVVARTLAEAGIESRLSPEFAAFVYWRWRDSVEWFIASRVLDGMWVTGVRAFVRDAPSGLIAAGLTAAVLVLPSLLGRPVEWLRFLGARCALLAPFAYFAVYAVLDAVVSVVMYPTQTYAITRWWLVSTEILLLVLSATLSSAAVAYAAQRLVPAKHHLRLAATGLLLLVALHVRQTVSFFWDGTVTYTDWNLSWNDESYRAAQWLNENVAPGDLVGSWNAGVLGYYTDRQVVNLDGLINNERLLSYIEQDRLEDYIRARGIRYLSDLAPMFDRELKGTLTLTEVYSHDSDFMKQPYRIYRVD